MLFMHCITINNNYLPLTGLLTLLQWTIHNTYATLTGTGDRSEYTVESN